MIAVTTVFVTVGVIGLVLNVLIQLITKNYKKYLPNAGVVLNVNNRNRYNMSYYVMRQLSLADTVTCLVAIPFVLVLINTSLQENTIFCKASFYFYTATNMVTFFNVVLIAFYRYCLVVHPLKYILSFKKFKKYVICCWISGFVLSAYSLYAAKPTTFKVGKTTIIKCTLYTSNYIGGPIYLLSTFAIPAFLTIYMCVQTIKFTWKQSAFYNKTKKITKMFVIVVASFLVTYVAHIVCLVIVSVHVLPQNSNWKIYRSVGSLTSFCSPIVNPLVYAFQLKGFRAKLWEKLSRLLLCDKYVSYPVLRDNSEKDTPDRAVTLVIYKNTSQR